LTTTRGRKANKLLTMVMIKAIVRRMPNIQTTDSSVRMLLGCGRISPKPKRSSVVTSIPLTTTTSQLVPLLALNKTCSKDRYQLP
jgi:hypothetical protein